MYIKPLLSCFEWCFTLDVTCVFVRVHVILCVLYLCGTCTSFSVFRVGEIPCKLCVLASECMVGIESFSVRLCEPVYCGHPKNNSQVNIIIYGPL